MNAEFKLKNDSDVDSTNQDNRPSANTPICNIWYRLLQVFPIIDIIAFLTIFFACKIDFFRFLLGFLIASRIAILVFILLDRKQVRTATGQSCPFNLLSVIAIAIFDVLYIDSYMIQRQKIAPETRRWPLYLSLLISIIGFYNFSTHYKYDLYLAMSESDLIKHSETYSFETPNDSQMSYEDFEGMLAAINSRLPSQVEENMSLQEISFDKKVGEFKYVISLENDNKPISDGAAQAFAENSAAELEFVKKTICGEDYQEYLKYFESMGVHINIMKIALVHNGRPLINIVIGQDDCMQK